MKTERYEDSNDLIKEGTTQCKLKNGIYVSSKLQLNNKQDMWITYKVNVHQQK